jgi:hypothetical protein
MVTLGLFFSEYPEWLNGMLEKRPPLSELQRRKPETMSLPEVLPFWTKQIGFVFPHCLVGWIFSQTIRCRTSKIYRDKLEWNGANPHKLDSARLNEDTNDIFVKLCLLIAIWHHDQVFLYASIWCWWSQSEVMAACHCSSSCWGWRSDTLWATLRRLWPHHFCVLPLKCCCGEFSAM